MSDESEFTKLTQGLYTWLWHFCFESRHYIITSNNSAHELSLVSNIVVSRGSAFVDKLPFRDKPNLNLELHRGIDTGFSFLTIIIERYQSVISNSQRSHSISA